MLSEAEIKPRQAGTEYRSRARVAAFVTSILKGGGVHAILKYGWHKATGNRTVKLL